MHRGREVAVAMGREVGIGADLVAVLVEFELLHFFSIRSGLLLNLRLSSSFLGQQHFCIGKGVFLRAEQVRLLNFLHCLVRISRL
jgi:hypothetical protein